MNEVNVRMRRKCSDLSKIFNLDFFEKSTFDGTNFVNKIIFLRIKLAKMTKMVKIAGHINMCTNSVTHS